MIPGFEERIFSLESEEELMGIANLLQQGASGGRSDDTKGLKGPILDWIVPPTGEPLQPPLSRNIKVNRGFNHNRTGFLLCPAELDWSNPDVQAALRNKELSVTGAHWPKFVYKDEQYNPTLPWKGLFRSELLVKGFKHIFTSPSSVDDEPRATRSGNARIHGMNQVTRPSLAYVATQVRFALTSSATFSRTDLETDSETFFTSVLECLEDPREQDEVKPLLAWWNQHCDTDHFGKSGNVCQGCLPCPPGHEPQESPISAGLNPTPNTCRTTLGSPEAGESGAVATVQQDASSDPPSTTTTHLVPVGETPMLRIVKEWQRDMALESFIKQPCAACSSMTCAQDIRKIAGSTLDLTLLRNDLIPERLLPKSYNFLAYDRAILDPEGLEKREVKANIYLCKHCASELSKRQMPKFALANWLYYAREHLPSDVKKAFEEMSIFEKALICRVRTNSLLCRFSMAGVEADPFNDKYIQTRRHIRGNVISTPLDVIKLNDVLPPSGTMLRDTICALIVSATLPTDATIESLTPILVRKSRVKLLIEFLVQNNPHYSKCEGFNGFSSEYLKDLFSGTSDTGIPAAANIGHLPINHAVESLTDDYTDRSNGVSGLFMENVAYTLGDHSAQSFLDMKFHAVEQCTSRKPFLHSRSGSRPVPDIENPAWLSWAHPNADPFGLGGFNDSRRSKAIGMEQQLKHILTANDPFFERDPELAFDVYNIVRKGAVNTSLRFSVPYGVYARTAEKIASLDKDLVTGLRQKYKRNPNYQPSSIPEINLIRVMSSIAPLARNIPVSVLATRAKSKEDILTLRGMDSTTRGNIAVQHPVACAQFFDAMMKAFIHIILKHGRKNAAPGIFGHCDAYYGTVETQGRGTLHCHLLIWLKDHLPAEKLADELRNSSEYGQALTTWIDSIMTSGFLGSRAVLNNLPFESDNDTVETKDPHPASKAEPLAREHRPTDFRREMKEYVDDLLTRFNWHSHTENTPWQDKVDEIIPLLSERDKKVLDNMALIAEGKQARDERPRGKNRGISESALLELENLPDLEAVPERPLVNIYAAALEPIEGGTDYRIRSKASDYLDSLLGPGASRAIQSCFPATSLRSSNTLESVTITHSNPGQNDADIISAHRKYMAASKRRKAPSDEEESGESGPKKRRRRRRVKEIHPAAEIVDTISLPSTQRNAATRPQAMEAARILASSKGLISNPEQFRAFMTIADHATKGGQQLLMKEGRSETRSVYRNSCITHRRKYAALTIIYMHQLEES
ncbi:hypothetical protein D9611_014830 [Ephemerocybe angulata]|uniref:Helitron helicase-like domain-containing protein n=1 Tax=Ephemerocybe angulata TaxID=980116 RepID=A0A8H5FIF2_9AGAR|nr:hypothetical protein D9611_014830 [Tulosesus angulatus]